MATSFRVKLAHSPSFIALAFINGAEYRNSDFKRFICDDQATLCKKLVNFGPVSSELKRSKEVHLPSISSSAMFAWRRHC